MSVFTSLIQIQTKRYFVYFYCVTSLIRTMHVTYKIEIVKSHYFKYFGFTSTQMKCTNFLHGFSYSIFMVRGLHFSKCWEFDKKLLNIPTRFAMLMQQHSPLLPVKSRYLLLHSIFQYPLLPIYVSMWNSTYRDILDISGYVNIDISRYRDFWVCRYLNSDMSKTLDT